MSKSPAIVTRYGLRTGGTLLIWLAPVLQRRGGRLRAARAQAAPRGGGGLAEPSVRFSAFADCHGERRDGLLWNRNWRPQMGRRMWFWKTYPQLFCVFR